MTFATLLGEPGKGIHRARLFGLARNDILGSLIISYILWYSFTNRRQPSLLVLTVVGIFSLGEVLHYMFGVNTAFLVWLLQ